MRRRFIGRGIYLLTAAHIAILIPHFVFEWDIVQGLRWMFITDTIGVNMIVGSILIEKFTMVPRIAVSLSLYTVSAVLAETWHPAGNLGLALKDVLVGADYSGGFFHEFFALLPWFAYYFASSVLGQSLARIADGPEPERRFRNNLWIFSAVLLGFGALVVLNRTALRAFGTQSLQLDLSLLISPFAKRPPSPMYFIVHCGMGTTILAAFLTWRRRNRFTRWVTSVASVLGRTSLVTYVFHYYIYFGIIAVLALPYSPSWPLLFAGTLIIITVFAYFADTNDIQKRIVFPSLSFQVGGNTSGSTQR